MKSKDSENGMSNNDVKSIYLILKLKFIGNLYTNIYRAEET